MHNIKSPYSLFLNFITNAYTKLLLKIIIYIIFILYIFLKVDFKIILHSLTLDLFRFNYLFLIYFFFSFGVLFVVYRWKLLLNITNENSDTNLFALSHPIVYSNLIGDIGFFLSYLVRTIIGIQSKIKLSSIISTVIFEKFLSSLALIILFLLSYIFLLILGIGSDHQNLFILFVLTIFLFLFILLILFTINTYKERLSDLFSSYFIFKYFVYYLEVLMLIKPLIISFFIQLLRVSIFAIIPIILNLDFSFSLYLIYLPVVMFVSSVTFTLNSWGLREAVFIYLYEFVGIDSNTIFLISISYGIFSIIASFSHVLIFEIINKYISYKK